MIIVAFTITAAIIFLLKTKDVKESSRMSGNSTISADAAIVPGVVGTASASRQRYLRIEADPL